jgi:beta-glucanase (GH16 family)
MFYNHSMVWTRDGYLHINTSSEQTQWKGFNPYKKKYDIFHKDFKGGMIQSWNKFCFSGGIVEISVRLPGQYDVGGLWPAFWLMGNLGRAVYEVRDTHLFI